MPLHLHCPTSFAVLLVGFKDDQGVLRFPSEDPEIPGLHLEVGSRTPINELLIKCVEKYISSEGLGPFMLVDQQHSFEITLAKGPATLYAATMTKNFGRIAKDWKTIVEILKGMPQGANRLAYLKALQVFAGMARENITAVASSDLTKDEVH